MTTEQRAIERTRRDWRYNHERVVSEDNARDVDALTSDIELAKCRVRANLDMAKRGSAGCWLENESLLAIRFVLESLAASPSVSTDEPNTT